MARITAEASRRVNEEILRAASAELAAHGYRGLRIAAVAKRIGKTQGAVYSRFPDKHALALAALRAMGRRLLLPRVTQAMSAAGSPIDGLEKLSAAIAEVAAEDPVGQQMFVRLASELMHDDSELGEELRMLWTTFSKMIRQLLKRARAEGLLDPSLDEKAFGFAVLGLPVAFATISAMFPRRTSFAAMEAALRPVLTAGITKGRRGRRS